ncbi:FAD-dependent monooxygenase [Streptomyces sp. NPDC046805]|uniref:FAD-dependent monooxygenase n=1 Tax=Streptomyces sp. NPDC046805 TaxID=3155134 RepID=UPI0033D2007B
MSRSRVQVAVVGAGPAGLVLANVLHRAGVGVQVWERHRRAHVEQQARAGVLEHRVVAYLREQGLADRLLTEASRHGWCDIVCLGERIRVGYGESSGGAHHWVYPQQLLVRDLIAELARSGCPMHFVCPVTSVTHDTGHRPVVHTAEGDVESDYVVGCDGAQGIVADTFPSHAVRAVQRRYPYDWITVLAEATHPVGGVLYAVHACGFAGMMPRAGNIARLYLEAPQDVDLAHWPEQRVLDELAVRLTPGPCDPAVTRVLEAGVLRLRSRVMSRLRHGRLFLAGDAAHVLTPSGGKGLNLAVADAADLAQGLIHACLHEDTAALDGYEERRLSGAWRTQEFSDRLLGLLHVPQRDAADREFELRLRLDRIRRISEPGPAATAFAREYAGSGTLYEPDPGTLHLEPTRAEPPDHDHGPSRS